LKKSQFAELLQLAQVGQWLKSSNGFATKKEEILKHEQNHTFVYVGE
jgi:hypothetical protein